MAEIGKAGAGNQSNVTSAYDYNAHGSLIQLSWEGFD
jgi:hypothetical protein